MSVRRQWIDEAFEEAMDVIKCGNKILRQASRLWSVPINFLSNYLNGKTWTKKVGVRRNINNRIRCCTIVIWILAMQKTSLSINLQQFKLKVAKITQTKTIPFRMEFQEIAGGGIQICLFVKLKGWRYLKQRTNSIVLPNIIQQFTIVI